MITPFVILAQQTTPSVAPAVTSQAPTQALYALLGGVLGAVLTGLVNLWLSHLSHKREVERDAKDAQERKTMARLTHQAEQKREEYSWLRKEKLKVYNQFAQYSYDLTGRSMSKELPDLITYLSRRSALNGIPVHSLKLLASENVIMKAENFKDAINNHLMPIPENREERYKYDQANQTASETISKLKEVLNEMRDDLGSPRISQDFDWNIDTEMK